MVGKRHIFSAASSKWCVPLHHLHFGAMQLRTLLAFVPVLLTNAQTIGTEDDAITTGSDSMSEAQTTVAVDSELGTTIISGQSTMETTLAINTELGTLAANSQMAVDTELEPFATAASMLRDEPRCPKSPLHLTDNYQK